MKKLAISLCSAVILTVASLFAYAQVVNPGGGGGSAITNYALETGGNLASLLASIGGNSASHTCATSFTNNGCLGQIDDDVKAPAAFLSQYPSGAVPLSISNTGTTSATTATLAAATSAKTWICGFSIRANANAAATNNSTVTGTVTGTLNFTQWTAPSASGLGITEMIFTPCVPSSAVNTGIAVISGAPGTGGIVSVSAWGYQL